MASTKKEYLEKIKDYDKRRDTYEITVPTGATFEVYKIGLLEALDIFDLLEIDIDTLEAGDDTAKAALGMKMITRLRTVSDAFLPRFVKSPKLVASRDDMQDCLKVNMLHKDDQWHLVMEIIKRTTGVRDEASQSFPDTSNDEGGGSPRA